MALSATSFLLKTTRICYENMPKTTRLATLEEGGSGTAGMLLVAGKERQGKRGCCAPMAALEDVERDDALTRLEHAEANGAVDVDDPVPCSTWRLASTCQPWGVGPAREPLFSTSLGGMHLLLT